MKQNQVYFDLEKFTQDLGAIKNERNVTYYDMAVASQLTHSIVSNVFNSCKLSTESLASLCEWADLDPREYFVVNSYK